MNRINLARIDLNLLVTFEALMDLGSVAAAAERLGRTPSAISHALARLREQVGDPLMVKVGGRMQPSPFALRLIDDIRPILRGIERVIAPPETFEPATSTRIFRLAVPAFPLLLSTITDRTASEAPNVEIEWLGLGPGNMPGVVEERIDLAMMPPGTVMAEGLDYWETNAMTRRTFARRGHPALAEWGIEAWLKYPHVVVGIGGIGRQTVQDAVERDGLQRRIGARVAEFGGLAALLNRTDNLGTFAPIGIVEEPQDFDLAVLEPPLDIPPIAFRFVWNARLRNDPASCWFRDLVLDSYRQAQAKTEAVIASRQIVTAPK